MMCTPLQDVPARGERINRYGYWAQSSHYAARLAGDARASTEEATAACPSTPPTTSVYARTPSRQRAAVRT